MFSENNRISVRQMSWILSMSWTAKLCLLYPKYLAGYGAAGILLCSGFGTAATLVVYFLMRYFGLFAGEAGTIQRETKIAREGSRFIMRLAVFLYFLSNASVFLYLAAQIVRTFLLPELLLPVLVLPFAAVAVCWCMAGIEAQGRFCEITGPFLFVLIWGLLLLISIGTGEGGTVLSDVTDKGGWMIRNMLGTGRISGGMEQGIGKSMVKGVYEVFACTDLLLGPLFFAYRVDTREETEKRRRKNPVFGAILRSIPTAGVLSVMTASSYGSGAMEQIPFPAIRVMGNRAAAGFLKRWEVLFVVVLLFGLMAAVGMSCWVMREEGRKLEGQMRIWRMRGKEIIRDTQKRNRYRAETGAEGTGWRRNRKENQKGNHRAEKRSMAGDKPEWLWMAGVLLAFSAAVGFFDEVSAVGYYRAFNMYLVIPFLLFMYAFVRIRKWKRTVVMAALLLVGTRMLSGCTAHEPEDRLFPMALAFSEEDGALEMTCLWNEGSTPGSKTEPGDKEGAQEKRMDGENREEEQEEEHKEEQKEETEGEADRTQVHVTGNRTAVVGSSMQEITEALRRYTGQVVDYSHVKAVIYPETLPEESELWKSVLEWMKDEPEFATGLIFYPEEAVGLTAESLEERSAGKVGSYLEHLYQNNTWYRERSQTLGEILAEYYAGERSGIAVD